MPKLKPAFAPLPSAPLKLDTIHIGECIDVLKSLPLLWKDGPVDQKNVVITAAWEGSPDTCRTKRTSAHSGP